MSGGGGVGRKRRAGSSEHHSRYVPTYLRYGDGYMMGLGWQAGRAGGTMTREWLPSAGLSLFVICPFWAKDQTHQQALWCSSQVPTTCPLREENGKLERRLLSVNLQNLHRRPPHSTYFYSNTPRAFRPSAVYKYLQPSNLPLPLLRQSHTHLRTPKHLVPVSH